MKPLRTLMIVAAVFLLAAIFAPVAAAQTPPPSQQPQQPPPSPCKTQPEYRQFDFWVGEWDVEVKGAPAGRPKPRSSIQLILNDCVVLENWMPPNNAGGKSFNLYNRVTKKWEQTWVDGTGGTIKFTGGLQGANMHYTSESTRPDGTTQLGRMTYFPVDKDHVRQLWETSTDGGKTWTVAFDGMYVRKK